MALTLVPTRPSQGNALIKRDVVTDYRGLTNDNTHAVIYKETPPDRGTWMNFDAGQPTGDRRKRSCDPLQAKTPKPMGEPVAQERVQTRVVGQHFESIASGGITMKHAVHIFP